MRIANFHIGQLAEVDIESLSYHGGRGVGRVDGMVVFVPWTAPGDRAAIEITEVKKTFLVARLIEILKPSPERRTPLCPVFGECGGCTWQHVTYERQLVEKQKILEASLRPLRKLQDFRIAPIMKSPSEFHYRNRIQINKFGSTVGFYARGTREIVPIQSCPISEVAISDKIASLISESDGRYELSRSRQGEIKIETGKRDPESALFSQVNSLQNERMTNLLLEWAESAAPQEIWDLYCGSGNLTLPLSRMFPKSRVTGVELSREAIAQAQVLDSSINWRASGVAPFLRDAKPEKAPLLVVLDPPRIGVEAAVVDELVRRRAETVIYVSCNPMTFARDAQKLLPAYAIQLVQGIDMFPQTEHVELIALFKNL